MADISINWPPLDAVYHDEYGTVDATIYSIAGEQWPMARRFAAATLGDEAAGLSLMTRAAAIVSRRRVELNDDIANPAAFLMLTFKRLVLGELKKRNRRRELESARHMERLPDTDETAQSLDNKILIEQIYARMDDWMKKAFALRLLGYAYEEMEAALAIKANAIRSKYSKELERLRRQIEEESRAAAHRVRREPSP
jgi:DNA-directed RNA polymerase specialized sigma24 family protein